MNGHTVPATQLINLKEMEIKNQLVEEATQYNADVNTNMTIEDMKAVIAAAKEARIAEAAAAEADKAAAEANAKAAKEAEEAEAAAKELAHKQEVGENTTEAAQVAAKEIAEAKAAQAEAVEANHEAMQAHGKEVIAEQNEDKVAAEAVANAE